MSQPRRAIGGRWSGLLFDNPHIGLAPRLTWTFSFDLGADAADPAAPAVTASIDWVPLARTPWSAMTGSTAEGAMFGTPIEASVFSSSHHRFDQVRVSVVDQLGADIQVVATVAGDIDGWGADALHLDDWLHFDGIRVALSDRPATGLDARTALAAHTDPDGLEPSAVGDTWHFLPGERRAP